MTPGDEIRDSTSATNSQVVDSVTEAIALNIGHAPSATEAMIDAVMAQTVGMAMHNAVTAQQNAQMVANSAVAATCTRILRTRRKKASNPAVDLGGRAKKKTPSPAKSRSKKK